jgi:pyruvate kinase
MHSSKAHIIATIGPASGTAEILNEMIAHNMDVARLNFSWGTYEAHAQYIKNIREAAARNNRKIPIIQDLSGPREQDSDGHRFDDSKQEIITEKDKADVRFGIEQGVDYVAMSYVGCAKDIEDLRAEMKSAGKILPIIAKIERKVALDNLDEIIAVADGIMVARGDLGSAIPFEQVPHEQKKIIQKAKAAKKPVIVATQMLLSMTKNPEPTRAEVTDVATAVAQGTDAVMLSEETAQGKYPLEAIKVMERIVLEAEKYHPENEVLDL